MYAGGGQGHPGDLGLLGLGLGLGREQDGRRHQAVEGQAHHEADGPARALHAGPPAEEVVEVLAQGRLSETGLARQRLGDEAHLGEPGLADGVHHGDDPAVGDVLVGPHQHRALAVLGGRAGAGGP